MIILFLDIDGVLNSDQWDQSKTPSDKGFPEDQFDPISVALLNQIIEALGAQIVLTSTWRLTFDIQQMNSLFKRVGIKGKIISFTPNMNAGNGRFTRGDEVQKWCLDNEKIIQSKITNTSNYLILDDKNEFLNSQEQYFFQTDKTIGITMSLVNMILEKYSHS